MNTHQRDLCFTTSLTKQSTLILNVMSASRKIQWLWTISSHQHIQPNSLHPGTCSAHRNMFGSVEAHTQFQNIGWCKKFNRKHFKKCLLVQNSFVPYLVMYIYWTNSTRYILVHSFLNKRFQSSTSFAWTQSHLFSRCIRESVNGSKSSHLRKISMLCT